MPIVNVSKLSSKLEMCNVCTRNGFFPEPHVDSAFTEFALSPKIDQLHGLGEQEFMKFVSAAFVSKRKTLVNNLKTRFSVAAVEDGLAALGMASTIRAEALTVDDFMQLFVCLTSGPKKLSALS